MHRRNFGWAQDRSITNEGNRRQTGHASLLGWQTRPPSRASPYKIFSIPVNLRNMAEQKKQERDFTPEVNAIIPETTLLAQVSELDRV